jgi:NPCBM-associated, NEW3 domain of alpha-galactosidase
VKDSNWGTARGAFELVRPGSLTFPPNNYFGLSSDAWDPSDFFTPQRGMTSPWNDGTAAKVAVRAIGNRGTPMRAYFDVRGPGVLVDTYTLANSPPPTLTLGAAGTISFPVMNTGEQTETFNFTVTGLPAGWTATTDTKTLTAGATATANVQVTPPLTEATGLYNLTAVGTNSADASVSTSSGFTVKVVQRPTTIVYNGDLTADYHDPAQLTATLTDTLTGAPLATKPVQFALGTQTASASTDAAGIASATVVPTQVPGTVTVRAMFAGDATYLGSSDEHSFTITREETTTTYTGPLVILQGAAGVTLSAKLLEDGTTPPVPAGQTLALSLGGQGCTATVDTSGNASCTLIFSGPLGPEPLSAVFGGDSYYLPSADTSKSAIVFALPARGVFILGDRTASSAGASTVNWWGAQWSARNSLSGGGAPAAFKGFADAATGLPTSTPPGGCSGTWTTAPGDSSIPVATVRSYMGVLVAARATQARSTISGTYAKIVVVKTDAGYAANPGHDGTGTIVATYCP